MTVAATGIITGAGTINGPGDPARTGVIANHGSIHMAASDVSDNVSITDHNYLVTFDENRPGAPSPATAVRVFAATFTDGRRTIPTASGTMTLLGWNTADDGSGTDMSLSSTISSSHTVYAQWVPARLEVNATPSPAVAGDTVVLTATAYDDADASMGDVTGRVTFTSSESSDAIAGDEADVTKAGTRTFTGTYRPATTLRGTAAVEVRPGAITRVGLTPSASSVADGATFTVEVTSFDAHGNVVSRSYPASIITSSQPADVIDELRITAHGSGARTLSVTEHGLTATASVSVTALARTGADIAGTLAVTAALLLAGVALVATRRRSIA
jgi:hypothetical protein